MSDVRRGVEGAARFDQLASRADLRALVEESPYALAMLDRDMRYVFVSRRWLTDYRLDLDNEQIRGRSHYDVFPEVPEHWRAVHRRALAGEVVKSDTEAFERADGRVDWVHWEVRPWRTDDGEVAGILIFTQDKSHERRAEDELRRWEYVFQNAAWGMSLATPDNRFIAVNRAFAKMHGSEPESWVGRPLLDMFAEESKEMLPALAARAHATGHIVYESIHSRADGSEFPVRTEVTAFKDAAGQVLFRAANFQDITELEKSQAALRLVHAEQQLQREFLERLIEASPVAIAVVHGMELRFTMLNTACRAIAGTAHRPELGRTYAEVFPEATARGAADRLRDVILTGTPWRVRDFMTPIGPRQETWWEGECLPLQNEHGVRDSALIITWEITDRKLAEWRLKDSEERFRGTFENAAVGIAHVALDGRWLALNERLCAILGYSREELLTTTFQAITHPDDLQKDLSLIQELVDGRRASYAMEKRYLRKQGGHLWANLTVSALRNPDGSVRNFISVVEDITARKQAENDLRRAVQLRDEFLSIASHELRTPLTALDLQLDGAQRLLEREAFNGGRDKLHRKIATALRQTGRLETLVEELLDVSRIATGRFQLELEEFDLVALVRDVVERFEEEAARKQTPISVHAPAALVGSWDRNRLDQAVTNIVSNAVKYGPGKPIIVTIGAGSDGVSVSVQDNGIGIAAEDLGRIFGRFERAVSANHYGGLGLGLYIATQIVSAHGGSIDAKSEHGAGATFTIDLPRRAAALARPAAG